MEKKVIELKQGQTIESLYDVDNGAMGDDEPDYEEELEVVYSESKKDIEKK